MLILKDSDSSEIVAICSFGEIITDKGVVDVIRDFSIPYTSISRAVAKIMNYHGLGLKWHVLAKEKTLFDLKDNLE